MPDELKMIQSSTLWTVTFHTADSSLLPIAQSTIQQCCLYFHNPVITFSCQTEDFLYHVKAVYAAEAVTRCKTTLDFASFSEKPVKKVANMMNAKKVFSLTGLYQDVFSDVNFFFRQNSVIDPKKTGMRTQSAKFMCKLQMPMSIEKKAAEGNTSANRLQNGLPP